MSCIRQKRKFYDSQSSIPGVRHTVPLLVVYIVSHTVFSDSLQLSLYQLSLETVIFKTQQ